MRVPRGNSVVLLNCPEPSGLARVGTAKGQLYIHSCENSTYVVFATFRRRNILHDVLIVQQEQFTERGMEISPDCASSESE
jgi:hypothetical protein